MAKKKKKKPVKGRKKTVKRTTKKKTQAKSAKKSGSKKKSKKKTCKGKAKTNKGGRDCQYKPEYAQMALGFCEDGNFSCRALAKKFKVSPQTILNWKREHTDFAEAIEQGKEIVIDSIEQTYFQLATPHDEVTQTQGETAKGTVDYESVKKKVVSESACKGILTAHRKDKYGNKVEIGGTKDRPIEVVSFAGVKPKDADSSE